MAKKRIIGKSLSLSLCLFLIILSSSACEKKNVFSLTEMEWILALINDNPNIFKDDLFDTQPDSTSGNPDSPSFYRQITFRQLYQDSIIISDTLVPDLLVAKIWETDSLAGVFHLYSNGIAYHQTSFTAKSKMRAYLEKWGGAGDAYNGWVIKGLSHVTISSAIPFGPYFSLNVTSSGGGVNYSYVSTNDDMLDIDYFPLVFRAGDTAYLHLTSVDKTNYIHLYYYDGNTLVKDSFTDNGSSLDAQFVIGDVSKRYRHFFIDIVDKGSVGPPAGNYRAKTWGILYRIR